MFGTYSEALEIASKESQQQENHLQEIRSYKAKRVGHLYALVIVQNSGKTPAEIQHALYVLLEHLFEEHNGCPFSTESWCYIRKNQAQIAADEETVPVVPRESYLNPAEFQRVSDVFKKFASLVMCATLTLGKTQNANESLNSVLWHNAPKTKRVGQKSLRPLHP